jgi:hypothetical protein
VRIFSGPALAVFFLAFPAGADVTSRATQLFSEGRDLLKSGAHEEACARFRESYALDPRVGTLMNIASCEEEDGHLVRAHETWRKAAASAREAGDARAAFATERDAAVVKRIPRLTLHLPPDAPAEMGAFVDGAAAAVGATLTVDPGAHVLTGTAPGRASNSVQISLVEGEDRAVTLELGAPNAPPAPTKDALTNAPAPLEAPRRAVPSWLGPAGYGAGAIGIAGIAVGTYFGIDAIQKKNESNANGCNDAKVCTTRAGYDLRGESANSAGWSTGLLIAGGVALAAGVALVVLAPRSPRDASHRAAFRILLQPGGVSVGGSF